MRIPNTRRWWCLSFLVLSDRDGCASFGFERARPADVEMSVAERLRLRDEVLEAFRHAYGSYMSHAYPSDELKPLSCTGRDWKLRTRGTIDDVLGGYGLTILDSIDLHAVVGDGPAFRETVATVLRDFESGVLSFDRDVVISVFEASIRVLGGLLSAHQIATELGPRERLGPAGWYKGELLGLAHDLGKRLLPAFDTASGIPVHRVNLRKGIPEGETRETCSAAAGTFLLEFGALSRLTGDPSFETAARRSVSALWDLRSPVGLVGGGLHGTSGVWSSGHASIGAGTDSFYEYLHKSEMLLGDRRMGLMFEEAYGAVEEHLSWQGWHVEADLNKGNEVSPFSYRVSALQAFWPAIQVSAGDVEAAESTYDLLFGLWEQYQALPDMYDVLSKRLLHYGRDSPLRPELAESTLALYQATGKNRYLRAGEDLLRALQSKSKVECGYAALGDVETGALDDRMDSFFIAETLKYLFLLFDSSLPSEQQRSIFCTPEQEEAFVGAPVATAAANQNSTVLARNSSSADAITVEIGGNVARSCGGSATPASENLKPEAKGKGSIDPSQSGVPTATQLCRRGERIAGGEDEADAERRESAKSCSKSLTEKAVACANLDDTSGACVEKRKEGDSGAAATFIDEEPQLLSSERTSSAAPLIPQCIRWSNTVLTTEGHPLLITPLARSTAPQQFAPFPSAETGKHSTVRFGIERTTKSEDIGDACETNSLNREMKQPTVRPGQEATPAPTAAVFAASRRELVNTVVSAVDNLRDADAQVQRILSSHVQGEQQDVISEPFDPRRYYKQAVRADRFRDSPKEAELEVKCYANGRCRFYDSGPKLLSYLKTASDGKWTWALSALCDWVNDTVFSTVDKTRLRDGEGVRYRLHTTAP